MRANRTIGLLLAASFASAGGAAAQQLLSQPTVEITKVSDYR